MTVTNSSHSVSYLLYLYAGSVVGSSRVDRESGPEKPFFGRRVTSIPMISVYCTRTCAYVQCIMCFWQTGSWEKYLEQ